MKSEKQIINIKSVINITKSIILCLALFMSMYASAEDKEEKNADEKREVTKQKMIVIEFEEDKSFIDSLLSFFNFKTYNDVKEELKEEVKEEILDELKNGKKNKTNNNEIVIEFDEY